MPSVSVLDVSRDWPVIWGNERQRYGTKISPPEGNYCVFHFLQNSDFWSSISFIADFVNIRPNYSCKKHNPLKPTIMHPAWCFSQCSGTDSISLLYRRVRATPAQHYSSLHEGREGGGVWGQVLTVALALLIGLIFVVRVYILSLSDPVQVTLQILLQLLLLTQLLEVSTSFGLLSLFGELSGFAEAYVEKKQKTNQTHKHTQRQTYFHCKQQNAAQNHVHLCPYCFLYNCMLQSQPISALCVFVNLSHWREMYTFERQQHYI